MDFGDILDKWENHRAAVAHNKRDSMKSKGFMESWLRANEVYNKDAEAERGGAFPAVSRRRLRAKKPDGSLDIHGLTRDEARAELERFFADAKARGLEKIRIIHGKGNHSKGEAVLGRAVREFIERCPYAGESGHEKTGSGGSGATWVLLKPSP
jgi:DNA-nicking Smr family endonuclease